MSYWCDAASNWLRARGRETPLHPNALLCAALAHGDIEHGGAWPYTALGLAVGGVGKPAANRWHDVLNTGRLRPPVDLPASAHVMDEARRS